MEFEVGVQTVADIDFAPSTETAEILQNVRTILSTPKYSVPLNREFGISIAMLDEPVSVAQARLTAEIITTVRRWEPRAVVTQVIYEGDAREGVIRPKVRVRILERS